MIIYDTEINYYLSNARSGINNITMCKKTLNEDYLNADVTKSVMAAETGREISQVQAFTLVVSRQTGKGNRKDLIQPGIPVKVWAEVNDSFDFAIRPLIKEHGKKAKVEIINRANVVSLTPLEEFEYNGKHYLRQRVCNIQRFADIRKK